MVTKSFYERLRESYLSNSATDSMVVAIDAANPAHGRLSAFMTMAGDGSRLHVTQDVDTQSYLPVRDNIVRLRLTSIASKSSRLSSTELAEAVGIPAEEIIDYESAVDFEASSALSTLSMLGGLERRMAIVLSLWLGVPQRVPAVLIVGDADPGKMAEVTRQTLASLPAPVRKWAVVIPVPERARRLARMLLSGQDCPEDEWLSLPNNHVCVFGAEPVGAFTATSLLAKTPFAKFDGRKIASAYRSGCEYLLEHGDISQVLSVSTAPADVSGESERDEQVLRLSKRVEALEEALRVTEAQLARVETERMQLQRTLGRLQALTEQEQDASSDAQEQDASSDAKEDGDADEASPQPVTRADVEAYDRLLGMDLPETVAEVCELARTHMEHVRIPDSAIESARLLDAHADTGQWRERTWRILAAMEAYAIAGLNDASRRDFRSYVMTLPTPPISIKHMAMHESQTVENNKRMREQRVFEVPPEVEPSGRVYMSAHARVGASGAPPSPRMYFYDDTRGQTRAMHVGYVGPHLTNKSTS